MDKSVRNTLRNAVTQCRRLLEEAVGELLQGQFGIHTSGALEPETSMGHLSAADLDYRRQVAGYLQHLQARGFKPADAVVQLIREAAFTHLNRLCAYKLLEKRKLIREAVSRGISSNGFKFYLADHPEDETLWSGGRQDVAYRHFLEWIGATLADEIGVLFSPNDPANRLFPPQRVLDEVLALINSAELAEIWDEDETVGWIYQYFTPKELRDKARKESQAPRNSYELAFRNQFYTPRYVVEFLVDNTLGRMWWEMTRGQTMLGDLCQYMVRKPHPIWLEPGEKEPAPFNASGRYYGGDDASERAMWTRPNPAIDRWMPDMVEYALTVDGYGYSQEHQPAGHTDAFQSAAAVANRLWDQYRKSGTWSGTFEDLRVCLFFTQRAWRHGNEREPEGDYWAGIQALHCAICAAWDREAEFVHPRPKRDPRELRILDPACGSGHFLLYTFDLLLTIYEEAWQDDDSALFAETGQTLRSDYPDLADLRSAIPGLILRHNLHGIDIDLRATQIAALALWLRAQRAYNEFGLKGEARPAIRRSNIVYAEPMPGEHALLGEFVRTLDPPALEPFVRDVWQEMRLAGEVGSLLKVESALREEIAKAKRDWIKSGGGNVQMTMFEQGQAPKQQVLSYAGVSDVTFYEREAEPRVLDALRRFAESAADGDEYTRHLFADDAARGFAMIEALGKRYDVVLMNPPFGAPSLPSKAYVERMYPRTKNDVYAAFVERGLELLHSHGRLGAITSRTGFFLTSFQKWREEILLKEAEPVVMADLGYGVLDTAMVETAAYVLERQI